MKRFLGNLLWLIFALPFYVTTLLLCGYVLIVVTTLRIVFYEMEPYGIVDKIDAYIYEQVKKHLVS